MRLPYLSVYVASLVLATTAAGCGDDSNPMQAEGTASESGSETTSQSGGDGDGDASSEEETGSIDPVDLQGELEFTTYASQPMVVDVLVRTTGPLADGVSLSWSHLSDPGVRFVSLGSDDAGVEHSFRIRGLAPATVHGVEVQLEQDDDVQTRSGEFTALAPLPGFVASIPVQGESLDPEVYRFFDWSSLDQRPGGVMFTDAQGQTRWYWGRSFEPGDDSVIEGAKILSDGNIAYGRENTLVIRDELSESLWELAASEVEQNSFHHELIEMPNGNLMAMGHEFMIETYPGEGDYLIAGDVLIEVTREGELVWTWSSFEHLDTQRVREGFHDLFPAIFDPVSGEQAKDWSHGNGIEFREEDSLLVASFRHLDWLVAIDYPSGDVQWRLGEGGDFDLLEGSWFFHQHSNQWQPDGSLVLYDNGNGNPSNPDAYRSRAVRYELDMDAMTATQVWEDDSDLQSPAMGDVDLMPSGQYLVTDSVLGFDNFATSHSQMREMDPSASPQQGWTSEMEDGRIIYRAMPMQRWVGEAVEAP